MKRNTSWFDWRHFGQTGTPLGVILFALLLLPSCGGAAHTRNAAPPHGTIGEVRFPEEWVLEKDGASERLSYIQQIEVRKPANSPGDEYFFAALPYGDHDYAHEYQPDMPAPTYSTNSYAVNFDQGFRVRAVSPREWGWATRIPTKPRILFVGDSRESGEVDYRGLKFAKTGRHWGQILLSPGGNWLAVFSYDGEKPPPSFFDFLGGGEPRRGDVFWDVYDAATGAKALEWGAKNVASPASFGSPVVWVGERYLMMPADRPARTFFVGTLPEFVPPPNPVTVNLPPRVGGDGTRAAAAVRSEAWAPLAPLTKEQVARITAPEPPRYEEVRRPKDSARREILLSIREESENRTRRLPGRDGAGEYNYRLFSTYYYAVTLDAAPQARFVTKEEWGAAVKVDTSRHRVTLDETRDTFGGERREYRPFPKTGESWGTPKALAGGEWVAVFSHTSETEGDSRKAVAGAMFVDVYDAQSGTRALSGRATYSSPINALFGGALWVEGSYLIVPLGASLESFRLWTLPGGRD